MKFYIVDNGDSSVGLQGSEWVLDIHDEDYNEFKEEGIIEEFKEELKSLADKWMAVNGRITVMSEEELK